MKINHKAYRKHLAALCVCTIFLALLKEGEAMWVFMATAMLFHAIKELFEDEQQEGEDPPPDKDIKQA